MSCGGGHLEFSIGIKKHKICRGPSNDHSWAVWFQLSKWFQRRSVLKLQILLKPNCTWMFIGWSSTNFMFFCADMKFKMAATAGLSLTLDPRWKLFQNAWTFSHRVQCESMSCGGGHLEFSIGMKKQKLCRGPSNDHSWAVFVPIWNSKWRLLQDLI
jgi:hypothetical protein